jgi:hypothetical protein
MDHSGGIPQWDFKLHGNTFLVAPGASRNGRHYEPITPWVTPPVVDPAVFVPMDELLRDSRTWAPAPGDEKRRRTGAWIYLRNFARVARCKQRGRNTLIEVCTHLTRYYGIDPKLAFNFLTTDQNKRPSWNARCLDEDGVTPYPWSPSELVDALTRSLQRVPEEGVREWQRAQERQWVETCLSRFVGCLIEAMVVGAEARVEEVHHAFQVWAGVEITATLFGTALTNRGVARRRGLRGDVKVRLIVGLDLGELSRVLGRVLPPAHRAS